MTPDRDIDRLLGRWLADGPTEAPDRVLDVVVDRIARHPQRPAWWLGLGPSATVWATVRLLAVASVLGASVVAGSILVGGGISPIPSPAPSPASTSTPSPALLTKPTTSLAPGAYVFTANGGRTTFTVPDGWSVPTIGNLDFSLGRSEGPVDDGIRVFYDMRVASKDLACTERPEPGVGSTAAEIVADIAANPGLEASVPQPISIGGLDGVVVDVNLASGYVQPCSFTDGVPSIPLVVDTVPGAGPFWGINVGERERLIVLDHPTATNVVFIIDSVGGDSFDSLVGAAMPVLETFRFK